MLKWKEGICLWSKDSYIQMICMANWRQLKLLYNALKSLTRISFLHNYLLAKVKNLFFISPKLGLPTSLEHSFDIIRWYKWGSNSVPKHEVWHTLRLTLLWQFVDSEHLSLAFATAKIISNRDGGTQIGPSQKCHNDILNYAPHILGYLIAFKVHKLENVNHTNVNFVCKFKMYM